MKSVKKIVVAALLVIPTLAATVAFTREDSSSRDREENFREYVTLLRGNLKAQRRDIITQLMQFDTDDAAAAKFFLIENQMQHIIDLQISAELPIVQTPSK